MKNLIISAIVILVIAGFFKFRELSKTTGGTKTKKIAYFPYTKKKYFLTIAERKFFEVLESIVGDNYYIFPQVHLSSLLYIKKGERQFRTYLNKINRKSVDFVVLDKQNLSPFLAVELDDSSHYQRQRVKRDEFVNGAFEAAEIPLLRIKASSAYDAEEVRKKMNEVVTKK